MLGQTYRIPNSNGNGAHLHVVAGVLGMKIILIPLTTYNARTESTCVLQIGDHPFITFPSSVSYKDAVEIESASLNSHEGAGRFIRDRDVSKNILNKIRVGATQSDFLRPKFLRYF